VCLTHTRSEVSLGAAAGPSQIGIRWTWFPHRVKSDRRKERAPGELAPGVPPKSYQHLSKNYAALVSGQLGFGLT
jgi:hypothetical protein